MQSTNAPAPDSGGIITPSTRSRGAEGGRQAASHYICSHRRLHPSVLESARCPIVHARPAHTPATPPARPDRRIRRPWPDLPGLPTQPPPPPLLPAHPRPRAPGAPPGPRYPLVVLDLLCV